MVDHRFLPFAMLAGLFGALSGVVGKLSVTGDMEIVAWARMSFFAANAVCTALMWRFFLKSLSLGPTAVASTLNTGTNFAVSALFGALLFGEEVTALWCVGAAVCCAGMVLIVTEQDHSKASAPASKSG